MMGSVLRGLLLLGLAGVCLAKYEYLFDKSKPPNSDEHGVSHGKKSTTCKCGWTNKAAGRIVGGEETMLNEYPHMAALGKKLPDDRMSIFCGSTIISEYHAITAAHCTHNVVARLIIIVGAHSMSETTPFTRIYDVNFLNHNRYNPTTFENDIAILYTKTKIGFNDYVGPACMPSAPSALQGQWVKVTGWGVTQFKGKASDVLRKVNLKVVSYADCSDQYRHLYPENTNQFCTYWTDKDSCQGDSGGPVTWVDPETNRNTLVGVVSYGYGCASTTPGVNTDVFSHRDWIHRMMELTVRLPSKTCTKAD